jgi:DNA-binding phage protein
MAKTETSEKRGTFWLGKPLRLRTGSTAQDYDPAEKLRDPKFIKKAVLQALAEGDDEAVVTILQAHLRVLNRSKAAKQMHVSRQAIHRLIVGSRKPSLPMLGAFMRLLQVEQAIA